MMQDFGLLILRVGFGLSMAFGHGWGKLANFSQIAHRFPDPIGLGSPVSLSLAVFAEFFCALLVVVGIGTRLASFPIFFTMLVASGIVHLNDKWSQKEMAVLYMIVFGVLILTGAGKYSLGSRLAKLEKYN